MSEPALTPDEKRELRQKLGNRDIVSCAVEVVDDRGTGGSLAFGLTLKLSDGSTITQRASAAVRTLAKVDAARRHAEQYRFARDDESGDGDGDEDDEDDA